MKNLFFLIFIPLFSLNILNEKFLYGEPEIEFKDARCILLMDFDEIDRTFFVSPEGNDSNPGTLEKPWKTISKAANSLKEGEKVYIRAGVYKERVVPKNSGKSGEEIVYSAYPCEEVIIDGQGLNIPEWSGLFDVSGLSYIKIMGFKITNSSRAGIYAEGSENITIEKNYIYNTFSSGIGIWSSKNIFILENEVVLANNDGDQENITVAGTDNFEVKGNIVHDGGPGTKGGEGIDIKDGSSNGKVYGNKVYNLNRPGIYVDAWDKHTFNIDIFQNIVFSTQNDGFCIASEMGGLLENIRIYNNLSYNNKFIGINISANGDSSAHPMKNIKIFNNTVYKNGKGEWGGGINISSKEITNVIIANNIVSQNLSFQIALDPGVPISQLQIKNNLIDGFRNYEGETKGQNYVEGNPDFLNIENFDFHLTKISPAINKGDNSSIPSDIPYDFDLNERIVDGIVDIGAYEFQGVEKSPPLPQRVLWQIQYTGNLNINLNVDVFNLDLFDAPQNIINELKNKGVFVMCYFSAGSYEEWRPDAYKFPEEVLGNDLEGWEGEKWLDIRRLDILGPIMEARLDLAVQKGCSGVDPDNVNGYENDTGFPLNYEDQLNYNKFLSQKAHNRGLYIGLKNDLNQINDLVFYFDWILNEECFYFNECHLLLPFREAKKPVFVIEYELEPEQFCSRAKELGFNALKKNWELDEYRIDCNDF